jgi:shikimate kinase
MRKTAEAISHGAVTVVNAMATGRGAALGIRLWTRAKVTLTNRLGEFTGHNLTHPNENTDLIETTARHIFRKFKADRNFGAIVETSSNIPIAVGLKSSSAASNAVALATLALLGRKASDTQAVRLGVEASLKARVTLTGAYDDACACYFGGLVVTDNTHRRILRRFKPKGDFHVLVYVPNYKKYTSEIDRDSLGKFTSFVQVAHKEALRGNYWNSLTLNGLIYCNAFSYDTKPIGLAICEGAIAAGLTGKGPAVAAIVPKPKVEKVLAAWSSLHGRVIDTSLNFQKAQLLEVAR